MEACKGCSIESVCQLKDYNGIIGECPCGICLVKITCEDDNGCDEYYDFIERVEIE